MIRLSRPWLWSREPDGPTKAWHVSLTGNGGTYSGAVGTSNHRRALCVRRVGRSIPLEIPPKVSTAAPDSAYGTSAADHDVISAKSRYEALLGFAKRSQDLADTIPDQTLAGRAETAVQSARLGEALTSYERARETLRIALMNHLSVRETELSRLAQSAIDAGNLAEAESIVLKGREVRAVRIGRALVTICLTTCEAETRIAVERYRALLEKIQDISRHEGYDQDFKVPESTLASDGRVALDAGQFLDALVYYEAAFNFMHGEVHRKLADVEQSYADRANELVTSGMLAEAEQLISRGKQARADRLDMEQFR